MQLQAGAGDRVLGIEIALFHAEKKAAVYQKALEAARLDAEHLCPGRSFTVGAGVETSGLDLEARMKDLTEYIGELQHEVKLMGEWMVQLPDGAHQARQTAQDAVDRNEQFNEGYIQQRRGVALALEQA
jgi:hypothetical protein